ncbi:MAG: tetratricopeptide repeat protein [Gemmatimonadota bacterium]
MQTSLIDRVVVLWLGTVLVAGCGPSGPPTYSRDVAGLLHENCSSCHRPEGVAPFPLLTYEDAAAHADLIAATVASGRMPPWLPSVETPPLEGERRLSGEEIEMLGAWAAAGAPRGDAASEPAPPVWPDGWLLGEPDMVLEMRDTFHVPSGGHDHFRNFVLPVPLEEGRWVRGVELRPNNYGPLHHGVIRVDPTPASRMAAAADSVPGFAEMFSLSESQAAGEFFLGWTPGLMPSLFPEGMAWRLEPSTDIVVQLHLMPTGQPEDVSLRIGLHFADEPPTVRPVLLRLGGTTLDIPPGDSAYLVEDRITIPADVQALAAYPHAHFLAHTMEVWGETPDGERITLMDIPDWDFNWQDSYRYKDPVALPEGTVVHLRYVYDNSAANPQNPHDPPQRVVYGPESRDEMAEFYLQLVPENPARLDVLRATFASKYAREMMRGWRHLIELDPDDAWAHLGLGIVAHEQGDLDTAEEHFRRAIQAQPDYPRAHHRMALVHEARGNTAAAMAAYRRAIAGPVENLPALNDFGILLAVSGDPAAAAPILERVIAVNPAHVEARNNLGGVLLELGRVEEALTHLERAVALNPRLAGARFHQAYALIRLGRAEEGVRALNQGLAVDGGNVQAALTVAWMLATHPDPAVRRPPLATELAEQIRGLTGPHPIASDVMAAALAANARYTEAVQLAQEAIGEARRRGQSALLPGLEARADLYRARQPFIDDAAGAPTLPATRILGSTP